jgi:hypothetical protein
MFGLAVWCPMAASLNPILLIIAALGGLWAVYHWE